MAGTDHGTRDPCLMLAATKLAHGTVPSRPTARPTTMALRSAGTRSQSWVMLIRSDQKRYEHLGVLHVCTVRGAEMAKVLPFLTLRRGHEKERRRQDRPNAQPGWAFEEDAPRQQKQ
jgi:hypothetical protein